MAGGAELLSSSSSSSSVVTGAASSITASPKTLGVPAGTPPGPPFPPGGLHAEPPAPEESILLGRRCLAGTPAPSQGSFQARWRRESSGCCPTAGTLPRSPAWLRGAGSNGCPRALKCWVLDGLGWFRWFSSPSTVLPAGCQGLAGAPGRARAVNNCYNTKR